MEVIDIKKQKIYEVIENPNLTKEEKTDRIAVILSKTDEEIREEELSKTKTSLRTDLENIYRTLFPKKGEEIDENKKVK